VSSETIGQNDLSHQSGLEWSYVSDLRVREGQFAAQVFELRERGDDRKEDRFFGVELFRNNLGRDRKSGLGQGRMIGGQDDVEEVFGAGNFQSVTESSFRDLEPGAEVVESADNVEAVVYRQFTVQLNRFSANFDNRSLIS
jgi:hypothetical protein